jgi:hypothetical protein
MFEVHNGTRLLAPAMGVHTLLRFLFGDRKAILQIAASGPALWVGALFVLSAGFAREYDGQDLLHEPWHLAIPFGSSLAASFVLFTVVYAKIVFTDSKAGARFCTAYRSFLALFWMTAPLAWLYAVPYERFLGPAQAVAANLGTLGVVAVWRVALMVRVVVVLMGYGTAHAFFLVMAFADAAALLAGMLMPRPLWSLMGGIRLSESERLMLQVGLHLTCWSLVLLPVWLLSALEAVLNEKPAWQLTIADQRPPLKPNQWLWALAFASVGLWAFLLPTTQAEQRLRYRVEQDLKHHRIEEALAFMSAHAPNEFPPEWEPPPRVGYGEKNPPLLDIVEAVVDQPPAPWVRAVFVEKFQQYLANALAEKEIDAKDLVRIASLLWQLPERRALLTEHGAALEQMVEQTFGLSPEDGQDLTEFLFGDVNMMPGEECSFTPPERAALPPWPGNTAGSAAARRVD